MRLTTRVRACACVRVAQMGMLSWVQYMRNPEYVARMGQLKASFLRFVAARRRERSHSSGAGVLVSDASPAQSGASSAVPLQVSVLA